MLPEHLHSPFIVPEDETRTLKMSRLYDIFRARVGLPPRRRAEDMDVDPPESEIRSPWSCRAGPEECADAQSRPAGPIFPLPREILRPREDGAVMMSKVCTPHANNTELTQDGVMRVFREFLADMGTTPEEIFQTSFQGLSQEEVQAHVEMLFRNAIFSSVMQVRWGADSIQRLLQRAEADAQKHGVCLEPAAPALSGPVPFSLVQAGFCSFNPSLPEHVGRPCSMNDECVVSGYIRFQQEAMAGDLPDVSPVGVGYVPPEHLHSLEAMAAYLRENGPMPCIPCMIRHIAVFVDTLRAQRKSLANAVSAFLPFCVRTGPGEFLESAVVNVCSPSVTTSSAADAPGPSSSSAERGDGRRKAARADTTWPATSAANVVSRMARGMDPVLYFPMDHLFGDVYTMVVVTSETLPDIRVCEFSGDPADAGRAASREHPISLSMQEFHMLSDAVRGACARRGLDPLDCMPCATPSLVFDISRGRMPRQKARMTVLDTSRVTSHAGERGAKKAKRGIPVDGVSLGTHFSDTREIDVEDVMSVDELVAANNGHVPECVRRLCEGADAEREAFSWMSSFRFGERRYEEWERHRAAPPEGEEMTLDPTELRRGEVFTEQAGSGFC